MSLPFSVGFTLWKKYCFKNIDLQKAINHRGGLGVQRRNSHRSISGFFAYFCSILNLIIGKKNKQKIQELSSREKKNWRRVNLAVSTCLKFFLAYLAVKRIYTLIYTPLQWSFLKQFCAAGMKRQTHRAQISPFCFQ